MSTRRSSVDLARLERRFEDWRSERTLGTRIPERLWTAAVEAAREHGVSKTAQVLRLDFYAIKKRLAKTERLDDVVPKADRFIEIPVPIGSSTPRCVLEVEGDHGGRLRLELSGLASDDLIKLVQSVWTEQR